MKPTKEELREMYIVKRISPEEIGKLYGISGRTIRDIMTEYDIPRLGPAHLRKGKSATWNIGKVRSEELNEKNRQAHVGKIPYNYGRGRISFACEVCGKEVYDKPYRKKRTCSKKCKDQLSHIHRGENHWNTKDTEPTSLQRRRFWSEYREWRSTILKNAKYTCAACKRVGGRLTAHHLYTWNNNPEKAFDPHNGVCLCWECHWSFHNDCSHHNTTPEMFEEWLVTTLK